MRLSTIFAAALLVVGTAACGGSSASDPCRDAFAAAVDTTGAAMEEAMAATLQACEDYDDWLAGLRGQTPREAVDPEGDLDAQMELMGFCTADAGGPVCADARRRGIIE